jgi:TatD DNase family protein
MSLPGPPPLVDTHAHIQDAAFDRDREAVLERARAAGLRWLICVGYDLDSSRRAVELANRNEAVYASVGVHPNHAGQASEADWRELEDLARQPKVVGLGETGLDNYRKYTQPAVQEDWFRRQLELASEMKLPVVIHNREADERVLEVLRQVLYRAVDSAPPGGGGEPAVTHPTKGVMHCFCGSSDMLEACLKLGFNISIAGPVTYHNADSLREVARQIPADRLVIETDSPYLPPAPHRGQRNEPAYVALTARQLAEVRGEPFEQLAERTTLAAALLFDLPIAQLQEAKTP